MDEKVTLRGKIICRYLRDDKDQFGIQISNGGTGNPLFAAKDWYKTREEAQAAWDKFADAMIRNILEKGGRLITKDSECIDFEVGFDATQVEILVGMVQNKQDGKFGLAFFSNSEIIMPPQLWFDDELSAFRDFVARKDEYAKMLAERGAEGVTINVPEGMEEAAERATAARTKKRLMPELPEGFDILSN